MVAPLALVALLGAACSTTIEVRPAAHAVAPTRHRAGPAHQHQLGRRRRSAQAAAPDQRPSDRSDRRTRGHRRGARRGRGRGRRDRRAAGAGRGSGAHAGVRAERDHGRTHGCRDVGDSRVPRRQADRGRLPRPCRGPARRFQAGAGIRRDGRQRDAQRSGGGRQGTKGRCAGGDRLGRRKGAGRLRPAAGAARASVSHRGDSHLPGRQRDPAAHGAGDGLSRADRSSRCRRSHRAASGSSSWSQAS